MKKLKNNEQKKEPTTYVEIFKEKLRQEEEIKNNSKILNKNNNQNKNIINNKERIIPKEYKEEEDIHINITNNNKIKGKGINFDELNDWEININNNQNNKENKNGLDVSDKNENNYEIQKEEVLKQKEDNYNNIINKNLNPIIENN